MLDLDPLIEKLANCPEYLKAFTIKLLFKSGCFTLDAPLNLLAFRDTADVELEWDGVSGATSYNIYQSDDGITFVLIDTVGVVTSYTDLDPGAGYWYYYVTAINSAGESPASNTVEVGPLDNLLNLAAAYSVRRLRSTYSGPLVNLRRDSDNAELDFSYDGNGDLDTAAITTWLAGANGFITTWYDQSGNGVNFVQATAANQPAYAANQTNGKPAMVFTPANSHHMIRASSFLPAGDMTAYTAMFKRVDHDGAVLYNVQASGNRFLLNVSITELETRVFRGAAFYTSTAGKIATSNSWHIAVAKVDATALAASIYRDGTLGTIAANVGFSGILGCVMGATTGISGFLDGSIAEALIFTAVHADAIRDQLESNLGAYYGVTVV